MIAMLAAASAVASCSRAKDAPVAKVSGSEITGSELAATISMEIPKYDQTLIKTKANRNELAKQVLDRLIDERVLLSEASRLGVAISDDEMNAIEKEMTGFDKIDDNMLKERGIDPKFWRESQRKRAVIDKLIKQEIFDKVPVADADIENYYKKHKAEFVQPAQYRARQIVVDTREQAESILKQLKDKADFEELAKKYSLSPDGKRGGDLGYFDAKSYPPIFSEICEKLKPGEISDVVVTDYGYQIFMLIDTRTARQLDLPEVLGLIRSQLAEGQAMKAFEDWFNSLKQKANVSIDFKALSEVINNEDKK
jgi:parvulin-like peptidyl-prolyl isomerase